MADEARKSRITVRRSISPHPMPMNDWLESQRIMAKLIARAYARQHPEQFGPRLQDALNRRASGSAPTARANAVAPAAKGADPESEMEM